MLAFIRVLLSISGIFVVTFEFGWSGILPFFSNFFSLVLCHDNKSDTESAKRSRRQLKDAMYSTLFDMNVPAVCAINQVFLQYVHAGLFFYNET